MAQNIVRATMRRGFQAYFQSCLPRASSVAAMETIYEAEELSRRRLRRRPPVAQSQPVMQPKEDIRGFHAVVCEGDCGECVICFEQIKQDERMIVLNCSDHGIGHAFHEECIMTWFKNDNKTCPVCRKEI